MRSVYSFCHVNKSGIIRKHRKVLYVRLSGRDKKYGFVLRTMKQWVKVGKVKVVKLQHKRWQR